MNNPPANAGDTGFISGLGRSPEEGNGNPLQYYCLGNPMDRGAWQATVHKQQNTTEQLSKAEPRYIFKELIETRTTAYKIDKQGPTDSTENYTQHSAIPQMEKSLQKAYIDMLLYV